MSDGAHVCHVTSVHVPTDSRVLYHECRSLASRYRVSLVCRDNEPRRTLEGVEIVPLPRTAGRLARFAANRELVSAAEQLGASLYHFHDPELLPAMSALARRTGVPVVYDAHEDYPAAMAQRAWIPRALRPVASRAVDRAERTRVPSMAAVVVADAALARRFEPMHERVVRLDNYPPLALFEPREAPPAGPPTMLYVGSVSAQRGFGEMLATLERVRAELPDARLIVYGRPTEEVAAQVASVSGDGDGGVELRGPIPYGEIGPALAEAHVGLSLLRPDPKYDSNVSMKVFDYMAAGLPYVASDFRPLREATKATGGLLVKPGDADAAAEAVLRVLRDEQFAARLGEQGRALVEQRLNWESVEERLFELYRQLLSR